MSVALPLEDRARLAMLLLALVVVADVFTMFVHLELISVIERLLTGERVPFSEIRAADAHSATLGIIQLVLWALTAIGFLLWFSRAYRNVIALGIRNPRFGTRWAIGCWFVPIVNLIRPKTVMNDIYRGSDPAMNYGDPGFASRPVSLVVHLWWGFFLLAGSLDGFAGNPDPYRTFGDQAKFLVSADVANIIAAVLAIVTIRMVTDRAELRRYRTEEQQVAAQRAVSASRPSASVLAPGSIPPPRSA